MGGSDSLSRAAVKNDHVAPLPHSKEKCGVFHTPSHIAMAQPISQGQEGRHSLETHSHTRMAPHYALGHKREMSVTQSTLFA